MNHLRLKVVCPRFTAFTTRRAFASGLVRRDIAQKYEEKLKKRAAESGAKDVNELRERIRRELEEEKIRQRADKAKLDAPQSSQESYSSINGSSPPVSSLKTRKDSSPIKPLDTILNLPKLVTSSPPLASDQLGALWTAYHARREGVLCAVVPVAMYEQMLDRAKRWSQFVVPLPRGTRPAEGEKDTESGGGTEMFFIEWGIHHSPSLPSTNVDALGLPITPSARPSVPNPPITTLLFTPLQEYKHRQSFAAPHLALTFYTDLAVSHDVVLLRGEITPAQQGEGRWMLDLAEAQTLVVAMQRFYLGGEERKEAEELLKCFHERPEEFRWEKLLELSDIGLKV